MTNKELAKSIRKFIFENHEDLGIWSDFDSKEMMGAAKQAAMQDIENSGEKFVDLGKSKFEKDLDIDQMLIDLEAQKHISSGPELKRIQKQINQLKRFGGGSLNEEGLNEDYFADKYADGLEKRMDKNKVYTNKEFLDLFTQKHALQHSNTMNAVKANLIAKGFSIEENVIKTKLKEKSNPEVDEDSLAFRHKAGQREKTRDGIPLGKHAPHSQAALKGEGEGISFTVKKGMNVKPKH